MIHYLIGWLIDFHGISTRLGIFYANWLENGVQCTFIFTIFVYFFLREFFSHGSIKYTYLFDP